MTPPLVVAGGGLAGGAAACLLARAGRQVALLEREAGPVPKICGEFISAEAAMYLNRLGLDIAALGAAPIDRVRLIRGQSLVETPLPFAGFGLSRQTLDEALLRHAATCGAEIRRGETINRVRTINGIALDLATKEVLRPPALFLATGKHDLRGYRRIPRQPPPTRRSRSAPISRHKLAMPFSTSCRPA